MKRLALAISLLVSLGAQAQSMMKSVEQYRFANFERNRIVFPSDSTAFERFFDKLDRLIFTGKGNINIVHIGGSHVQAGVFTQQLRRNLLTMDADLVSGRGLVFPFSAAKTNNPPSFKTHYTGKWTSHRNTQAHPEKTLGLTGIALSTNDTSATLTIVAREQNAQPTSPKFLFNKVSILCNDSNNSLRPILLANDTIRHCTFDAQRQLYTFNLAEYTDSICVALSGTQGEFSLRGILLESDVSGITVHGIGVNGASLNSYFRCEMFDSDLALLNPDLMIFAIGINDATSVNFDPQTFIANYDKLIQKIQNAHPDCALLFVTNNDSFRRVRRNYQVNRNGQTVERAFFKIAKKHNGGVWNLFDIMGGLRSMQQWEDEGLAKRDKIHFTYKGYTILGDLLYNALMERYTEHLRLKYAQKP